MCECACMNRFDLYNTKLEFSKTECVRATESQTGCKTRMGECRQQWWNSLAIANYTIHTNAIHLGKLLPKNRVHIGCSVPLRTLVGAYECAESHTITHVSLWTNIAACAASRHTCVDSRTRVYARTPTPKKPRYEAPNDSFVPLSTDSNWTRNWFDICIPSRYYIINFRQCLVSIIIFWFSFCPSFLCHFCLVRRVFKQKITK